MFVFRLNNYTILNYLIYLIVYIGSKTFVIRQHKLDTLQYMPIM